MTTGRRVLSLLLCAALALTMLGSMPAYAADGERDYRAGSGLYAIFDGSLYSYLKNNYDADGDGKISLSEMDAVTTIDGVSVGRLSGLQLLSNVTSATFTVDSSEDTDKILAINDEVYFGVNAPSVNVRKGAADSYPIVGSLKQPGIILKPMVITNGWLQIRFTTSASTSAYISTQSCQEITRTNTVLRYLSCWGEYYLNTLDISRVPNLADAVINGTKDDSSPDYDRFVSAKGELRVDKETRLKVGAPVNVPLPTVVKQPEDRTVASGIDVTFSVKVSGGEGPYTFQWYSRAGGSDEWKKGYTDYANYGVRASRISVTASAELDGTQYYCLIYDRYYNEIASDIATLTLTDDFSIAHQPEDRAVEPGQAVSFSTAAINGTTPYTFQWYYRTGPSGAWKAVSAGSGTTDMYRFTAEARHNGYQYYCAVTDAAGRTVQTRIATLTADDSVTSLRIIQQPQNASAAEGEIASTTVVAQGYRPTYEWWVKNPGQPQFYTSSIKKNTYSVTMTTQISGQQVYCVVTDANGTSVRSDIVKLTVSAKQPLSISSQPVSADVTPGETVTFSVTASGGTPPYTYQWWSHGPGSGLWFEILEEAGMTADYSFMADVHDDGYEYNCEVTDANGNSVLSDTVTLTVTPTTVHTPLQVEVLPTALTVAAGETAAFSATAGGGTAPYTYQWYYCTPSSDKWTAVSAASGITANYSLTAEARHDGYRYYCHVTDAAGIGTDSAIVTLKIAPGHIPGDINGDSKVNNRDLTRLAQYLAGKDVEYVSGSLDVNGDGKVNNRDLTRLAQYLAGKEVELH